MMIENGQVTMVASGSMPSLATIESPDETSDGQKWVSAYSAAAARDNTRPLFSSMATCLMSTALQDENPPRGIQAIP